MPAERISATYLIETALDVNRAAAVLAGEQSSGTFVDVPGETDEIRRRYRAQVEKVTELENGFVAQFTWQQKRERQLQAHTSAQEIVVSWSIENVGYNLPTLLSTIQGNLYELREFSGLKLADLNLPDSFGRVYPGPRFGVSGTRAAMWCAWTAADRDNHQAQRWPVSSKHRESRRATRRRGYRFHQG